MSSILQDDVQNILIPAEAIQRRVSELAADISQDYSGKNLLVVGVLKGVLFFMADLLRGITVPVEMDFIAISSYSNSTRDQGLVRMIKDLDAPLFERHVLFVEDVIDTGLTLNYILRSLRIQQPASLEVCVLFNKPVHRLIEIPIKYKGFDLPDKFVVGYGLDYQEKYRNLPYVGMLRSSAIKIPPTKK